MDWSTVFMTFLVGSFFTLVAVLAGVLKTSCREVSASLLGNTERKCCNDPSSFGGRTEDFDEWPFSVQEALRTLQPADPVGYVASFLEARKCEEVACLKLGTRSRAVFAPIQAVGGYFDGLYHRLTCY